jgi:hypothetical protein
MTSVETGRLALMNMGGPTDHWYTDLFTWDRPAFSEPIDSLVREIRRFGGDPLLRDDQPLGRACGTPGPSGAVSTRKRWVDSRPTWC